MMLRHPVLYAYPFGLCGVTLRGAPCEIHIFRFRIAKTAVRVAFHSDRFACFAAIPFFKRLAFQIFFSVCHFGFLYGLVESVISCWILLPINLITGTAMLLPTALYRGLSGHSAAGLPRHGICVWLSGKPCRRSHSVGDNLRMYSPFDTVCRSVEVRV